MGAFSGSISYKMFFVQGDLPDNWKTHFLERIEVRSFEPLEPHDGDEEAFGWVPIRRPLSGEFPYADVVFNDYLNLGFRRDRYSISRDLVNARLAAATREYLRQNEQEKLTKLQKEDLEEMVRRELKEKTLPSMRVIDMSWQLSEMRVRFWSQSNKLCEIFQAYFEDTFGLKLLPASPYTHAVQQGLDADLIERLGVVEPSHFVRGTTGVA